MLIGEAPIDQVREMAIKNAIANASFKAGAMVTAQDIVLNGLLVGSKVVLRTHGLIRRAEVISEVINNGILTVTVKVDINHSKECFEAKYTKRLLINQFRLMKPKQASIGGLFELGRHISKRIEQQIDVQSDKSSVLLLDEAFSDMNVLDGLDRTEIASKANYLGREYGYQFALFGVIRDISVFNRVKKKFLGEDVTTRRSFTIRLYLLDVYHQSIIQEESYHAETNWDFDLDEVVDLNSSIFWQSSYGRAVLDTVNGAIVDMLDVINCTPLLAQIIDTVAEGYIINLGTQHGVKNGDYFTLNKIASTMLDRSFSTNFIRKVPNSQMQIIATNKETSLVTFPNINNSVSARLYDLLSPEEH
ncbi:MAG: flagellar assembly protein T N-terminal domain-containing protein [Paraglaciecola sp.]|nr:flagellar assembly protein T N-terminal domain-containing protein [Paraglaciecola sp.]